MYAAQILLVFSREIAKKYRSAINIVGAIRMEDRMYEQVLIEEQAHFLIQNKDIAERYAQEKKRQGYKVKIVEAEPMGYIVSSYLWIGFEN